MSLWLFPHASTAIADVVRWVIDGGDCCYRYSAPRTAIPRESSTFHPLYIRYVSPSPRISPSSLCQILYFAFWFIFSCVFFFLPLFFSFTPSLFFFSSFLFYFPLFLSFSVLCFGLLSLSISFFPASISTCLFVCDANSRTHAPTRARTPLFFALLFSHFFPLSPSHDGRHVRLVVFVVLRAFLPPPPFFAVALIVSFWSRSLVLSLFRLLFHTLSLSFSLPLCCGKEKEDGVETCPAGQPESAEEQEKSPRSMRRRTWLTNKTTKATGSRNLRDGVRNERHMRSGGSL